MYKSTPSSTRKGTVNLRVPGPKRLHPISQQVNTWHRLFPLHLKYWFSYLTALVLSVLWNFTLNRRFTFKSASNVPIAMLKVFAYYCVFTPVTTLLGNHLVENLGWNEYLVTIMNMVLNFVTEFLYQRFVVFRNTIDTNELARKKKETDD